MKCGYCNKEVENGFVYCPFCGHEIRLVPDYNEFEEDYLRDLVNPDGTADEKKQVPANRKQTDTNLRREEADEGEEDEDSPSPKDSGKKLSVILFVFLGILLIVAIIAVFTVSMKLKQKRTEENSFDYQVEQAEAAADSGNVDTAIKYYKKAIELHPSDMEIRFEYVSYLISVGKREDAEAEYRKMLEFDDQDTEVLSALVALYEEDGDFDAIKELSQTAKKADAKAIFVPYKVTQPSIETKETSYAEPFTVSISCDSDCRIYYTLDNSDPAENGKLYEEPIEISSEGKWTVKAACKNEKGIFSDPVEETYSLAYEVPSMPEVTPEGGDYTSEQTITIVVPANCSAYYTWDGTDPGSQGTLYTAPLELPEGNNVLSVVIKSNYVDKESQILRNHYTYYPAEEPEEDENEAEMTPGFDMDGDFANPAE